MSFKEKIPGCFGCEDKIFSGHTFETERAKEMLIEALSETNSWSEFEKALHDYLESQNCSEEHIANQLKRVTNLTNYFSEN